jgi:hypothetical protein
MRLIGIATPVWGSLLDTPEGWVASWYRVEKLASVSEPVELLLPIPLPEAPAERAEAELERLNRQSRNGGV